MKIDRRVTNGLAWAGVFIVVGVPAADLLSAQFLGDPEAPQAQVAVVRPEAPLPAPLSQRPAAPAAEVTEVAAVATPVAAPAKPAPAAQPADAVDAFLQSGRKLPSYITDGADAPAPQPQVAATQPAKPPVATPPAAPAAQLPGAQQAQRPVITTPAAPATPVETDPIQVAAIPPAKVAPVPMPLSMRPEPIRVPTAAAAAQDLVVLPPTVSAPLPPANVTAADLEDWESGPLSEFLAKQQGQGNVSAYYDNDGFFLDEGPNGQRPQRDRIIGPVRGDFIWFAD